MAAETTYATTTNLSAIAVRTRAGCIGCKLRRKKCDERKPRCGGCERNFLLCTWPDPHQKAPNCKKAKSKTKRTIQTASTTTRSTAFSRKADLPRSSGLLEPQIVFFDGEESLGPLSYGSGFWDKNDNSCDQVPKNLCSLTPIARRHLELPRSKIFFEHYLHRTSATMSVRLGDTNPFLAFLVPMAMTSNMIFQGLLALSGVHYACQESLPFDQTTWLHYGQMVKSLIPAITKFSTADKSSDVVELFFGTILLCIIETMRGDGKSATHHIKASRPLLLSVLQLPVLVLGESTRVLVSELYTYLAATSNMSLGEESDLSLEEDASFLLPIFNSATPNNSGMWCGGAGELFSMIPKVSILARRQQHEALTGTVSWESTSAQLTLKRKISAWKTESTNQSFIASGMLYQQALLVYLCSSSATQSKRPSDDSAVVKDACLNLEPLLDSMPIDSPISTTGCWPLVVIGSCTKNSYYQDLIRKRLKAMWERLALRNIHDALSFLEHVWATKNRALDHPLEIGPMMLQQNLSVLFM